MGMEIGVVIPGEPGVFASLLLPETVQQLQAGEPVTALGLTEGRLAVGAAAGYLVGQMFQVTSLYVAPDYRRQGGRTAVARRIAAVDAWAGGWTGNPVYRR